MAEILRIPDGNAFKLRITGELLVENYRSAADMSVVSRLIVNFVRRGRLPQVASVDDQGRIVALNLGLLPRGTYGVELTGYYNGEPWRFFQQDVFAIVDENSELSESTGGDVPIYDTTFTVSFRGDSITAAFVDAALNAHNNDEDAHPHLQQAIEDLQEQVGEAGTITDVLVDGESVVEGKVARISTEGLRESITDLQNQIETAIAEAGNVDDVQIDGSSILDPETKVANIDTSLFGKVDDVLVNGQSVLNSNKKALVPVPSTVAQLQDAADYVKQSQLTESQATKQDKIDIVVSPTVTDDGGSPAAEAEMNNGELSLSFKNLKLRFSDLTAAEKETLRGPQGLTTVYDPNNPTDLLSTLQTTAGWSQQHTMTQKAITEAIESNTVNVVKSWVKADLDEMTKYQAISPSTGNVVSSSASWGSRRIAVSAYRGMRIRFVTGNSYQAVITFVKSWVSTAGNPADFCDGISSVTTIDKNEVYDTVIPDDCTYLYVGCLSQGSTVSPTLVSIFSTANERLDALEVKDTETDGKIKDMEDSLYIPEKVWLSSELSSLSTQWPISSSGSFTATSGNNSARRIAFSAYKGMYLEITANADYTARYAFMKAWPGSSGVSASDYYCEGETIRTLSKGKSTRVKIPSDCLYLYVDNKYSGNLYLPEEIKVVSYITEKVETKLSRVYLSAAGNDGNDGSTSAKAKATFAAAMNAGAADMTLVLSSDIAEPMNFSAWSGQKTRVTVRGTADVRRRIILGKMLTELQQYSNYDDVYTWQPGAGESLPSGNVKWLWQHELPDVNTEINTESRHPLQRGRQYRRLSTCIEPETSLANLLSATSPCWVVDNGTLYVRAAAGSNVTTNPIVIPTNSQAAIVGTGFELNLFNIEAWYGHIEPGSSYNFRAVDCAARYSVGDGAWMINDAMCAHLERCEADSNTMPTKASGSLPTGDGFNIHPTSGEDIYAKGGTHTLIDCWAHDNRDDGYSDHGRSEGTIIGGLYEYNGKGGLTPAVGAHDTIYNAVCRNHPTGSGILFTGAPAVSEGGMGGQVECFGCVCTSNKWNYKVDGALSGSPEPNRMILNHCISRNASEAALYAQTNSKILARECTDSGSATKKKESGGSTSIVIDNGTLIS